MIASELQNLELHYLTNILGSECKGRGEYVRLLLQDAGLDFQYIRYTFEDWPTKKKELIDQGIPYPTLPYITINGKYYGKVLPIIRFVSGKLGQYQGKTDDERQLIDAYADMIMDWSALWAAVVFKLGSNQDKATYDETTGKTGFSTFDSVLAKAGPYLMGESISYADFLLFHMVELHETLDHQAYPNLGKFMQSIKNRPNLKDFLATTRQ